MDLNLTVNSPVLQGFFDELEKIAAPDEAKHNKPVDSALRAANAVGVTAATGLGLSSLARLGFDDKSLPSVKEPILSPKQKSELWKNISLNAKDFGGTPAAKQRYETIRKQMGITIPTNYALDHGLGIGPASASLKDRSIVLGKSNTAEAVIAHELGHVKNTQQLGHKWKNVATGSRLGSMATGLPMLYASAISDEPDYTAGAIHAGISAPLLVEEGLANARSLKHMVKQHGVLKGLKKSWMLAPAMGTYIAGATAPLAVTAVRKYLKKKKEDTNVQT